MTIARRSGIIPFSCEPNTNEKWFCLAMDSKTKELGDFGGGVRQKETSIRGAIREFNEESLGVFNLADNYIRNHVKSCITSKTNKEIAQIFFVKIPWDLVKDSQEFFQMLKGTSNNDEISNIVWINEEKFKILLEHGKASDTEIMWHKVKRILSKCDFDRIQVN